MQQVPSTISVIGVNRFEEFLGHRRIGDHVGPDGGELTENSVDVGVPKGRGVGRLRSDVNQD